jgi:hypothetical protein
MRKRGPFKGDEKRAMAAGMFHACKINETQLFHKWNAGD